jgi:hypothetical protein
MIISPANSYKAGCRNRSVDTDDYVKDKHNKKTKTNYRQAPEEERTLTQKSKQTKQG